MFAIVVGSPNLTKQLNKKWKVYVMKQKNKGQKIELGKFIMNYDKKLHLYYRSFTKRHEFCVLHHLNPLKVTYLIDALQKAFCLFSKWIVSSPW